MMSKMIRDQGTKEAHPSGVPLSGLEGVLAARAATYLRSAHGMRGEVALEAAALAARRAVAATPHWRLDRAGAAVIAEAAHLAGESRVLLATPLIVLPEAAPHAMPEQNLDRLGMGDLFGGTRRVRRRLRARLRTVGATPALVLAALLGMVILPGLPH